MARGIMIRLAVSVIFVLGALGARANDGFTPGRIPPDPEAALATQLRTLGEEELFEKAEGWRLGGNRPHAKLAYEIQMERFGADGAHAAKASYELARFGLSDGRKWDASIDRLHAVAERYPRTQWAVAAAAMHRALTAPSGAADVEQMVELAEESGRSIAGQFTIKRIEALCDREPVLEWLAEASEWSDYDRALLGARLAQALVRASRFEKAREAALWVSERYGSLGEPAAIALAVQGRLSLHVDRDLDQAETSFRRISKGSEKAPATLFELALQLRAVVGREQKSRLLLEEIREQWPLSPWAQRAAEALGISGAETSVRKKVRQQLAQKQAPACGPYALRRVCERLGVSCSAAQARALCPVDGQGRSSLLAIKRGLEAKGLQAQGRMLDLARLRDLAPGEAAVLHLRDHFVVLESLEEGRAVLSDWRQDRRVMNLERLAAHWDGYAVVVAAGGGERSKTLAMAH